MKTIPVELGQKVYFDPFADMQNATGLDALRGRTVEGTVDFINSRGNWFSVIYEGLRTSFFFQDIGKTVFHNARKPKYRKK